jgi:ElaB/YqjD/DUF883 family membrane-anchored ribosome-binding protein
MKNNKAIAQSPKDLLVELQELVAEAETMIAGSPSEHSGEALADLQARFAAAQERFVAMFDGAKKKIAAGARFTDAAIRENPYQSLAIALGVGMAIGVLVGRRS